MNTASNIRIDSDENGFELHVYADEDEGVTMHHAFLIPSDQLDAFYDQVKARIGPYLREMHEARDAVARGVTLREFVCAPADVDESGGVSDEARDAYDGYPDASGYHITDPKHPDFHSVHADIWDTRDGK